MHEHSGFRQCRIRHVIVLLRQISGTERESSFGQVCF
jgi:hypothetical protein